MLLLIEVEVSGMGDEDESAVGAISAEVAERIESMLSAALYSMDGY